MGKSNLFGRFYLDKEKDIIVNLYKKNDDELEYILETPNHNTGNLISNLAKLCGVKTSRNLDNMKIIKGTIPASIDGNYEEVYIFRLGGVKIANIYSDGGIAIKAMVPAISKTLMSQTKNYNLSIDQTLVKSYILKKSKFRTDLHTHMNANLPADCLIALGLKHQILYPLYYIKKLDLKLTQTQKKAIYARREKVAEQFKDSTLKDKSLIRRIDDNTYINFADLILNNLKNAEENLYKIKKSLEILKDGQAVFTNLEKLYLYRYVFAKGIESKRKMQLHPSKIQRIPDNDVKNYLIKMLEDSESGSKYLNNSLRQDKLLWIAREYQKQGIYYTEISDTTLTKKGLPAIELLEEVHEIMPIIEQETNVKIRFLVAIRRIPLTIIKDVKTSSNYLSESINVMKAVSKSPYVVGCDFVGEEINDIAELKPAIREIVQFICKHDKNFTIRIHAGENDSLRDNVYRSIKCIVDSLEPGQKIPNFRIGHGLYTAKLDSEDGMKLIRLLKKTGGVLEFQLTSNVRLNNLSNLEHHPIKAYLSNNVKCVQGTDGCGLYGTDTTDEQLTLHNLLGLTDKDFAKIKKVENDIIKASDLYFKKKSSSFNKFLKNRSIREAILDLEDKIDRNDKNAFSDSDLIITNKVETNSILSDLVKDFPKNKIPVIIAGGSFNSQNKKTYVKDNGKKILHSIVNQLDPDKFFFVIGHSISGYEEELINICKLSKKKFEIYAIVPKLINEKTAHKIMNSGITGIRISIESEEFGLYKSFNYEIFERRESILIAFAGHSPVSNLVQEAKNGKGSSRIYLNVDCKSLSEKANSLQGYVYPFTLDDEVAL